MTDFIRRHPLIAAVVAVVLLLVLLGSFPIVPETKQAVVVRFGKPVRILNRYQAGPADRRGRRRHLLAHPVRRAAGVDRQARPGRRHAAPAGAVDRPAPAPGRRLRALPDRRSAADVHPRRQRGAADASSCARSSAPKSATSSAASNSPSLLTPERQGIMDSVRTSLNRIARQYGVEDHRRSDQAHRSARRRAAAGRVRPHAHGARAGSASIRPRAPSRRRSSRPQADADAAQNLCGELRQGPAISTISTARCRATRSTFVGDRRRTRSRRQPSFCRRKTTI